MSFGRYLICKRKQTTHPPAGPYITIGLIVQENQATLFVPFLDYYNVSRADNPYYNLFWVVPCREIENVTILCVLLDLQ